MKPVTLIVTTTFIALLIIILQGTAFAASGSITILEPVNGEILKNESNNELQYNITLSPSGNHVHVYIDDQPPIIDRKVTNCPCSIELPTLSAGKHKIVIKEATVNHALTGLQSSVTFSVK